MRRLSDCRKIQKMCFITKSCANKHRFCDDQLTDGNTKFMGTNDFLSILAYFLTDLSEIQHE